MSDHSQPISTKRTRTPEAELVDSLKKQRPSATDNEAGTSARISYLPGHSDHVGSSTTSSVGAVAPSTTGRESDLPVHGIVPPQPPRGLPPLPLNPSIPNPSNLSSSNPRRIVPASSSEVATDMSHLDVASRASAPQISLMTPQRRLIASAMSLIDPPSAANMQRFASQQSSSWVGSSTAIGPVNAVPQVTQPRGPFTHPNTAHHPVGLPVGQHNTSMMPTPAPPRITSNPPAPQLVQPHIQRPHSYFGHPQNPNLGHMQTPALIPRMEHPHDRFNAAREPAIWQGYVANQSFDSAQSLNSAVSNIGNPDPEIRRATNSSSSSAPLNSSCGCSVCSWENKKHESVAQLITRVVAQWRRDETITKEEFQTLLSWVFMLKPPALKASELAEVFNQAARGAKHVRQKMSATSSTIG